MLTRLVHVDDGRSLRCHDTGPPDGRPERLTVVWHHGSPQTGAPLSSVVAAATDRGIRVVTYARPGYADSTRRPERTVVDAAADVRRIADAMGIGRFATIGASGGGPHALACAAALPTRVIGVVTLAGIAPCWGPSWFDGMVAPGGLRAARHGRSARTVFAATETFDENSFTDADRVALAGAWRALGEDAGDAGRAGPNGLIDDDVAFAGDWGFDPADIAAPVLVVQGDDDRVVPARHGRWLAARCPNAELSVRPGDGHISVLDGLPAALDWLMARSG